MYKKEIKKIFLKFLLLIELVVFSFTYLFGQNGILFLISQNKENKLIKSEIFLLKHEIQNLEQQINDWNSDNFFKEKNAREQLQMAKPNEEIYYF